MRGKGREDVPVVIEKGRLVGIIKVNGSAFVSLNNVMSREGGMMGTTYV